MAAWAQTSRRTAICELLDFSNPIRQLILERRSSAELKKAAREEGITNALEKVFSGTTTLNEVNKVTFVE